MAFFNGCVLMLTLLASYGATAQSRHHKSHRQIVLNATRSDVSTSIKGLFAGECRACEENADCESGMCWGHKCVYNNEDSKHRCFDSTLNECQLCIQSSFCKSGKCWGSKSLGGYRCVKPDSVASMKKCFPAPLKNECEPCTKNRSCKSKRCFGSKARGFKCVKTNKQSVAKCFPPTKKNECSTCKKDVQCKSGICWGDNSRGKKCIKDRTTSVDKCFRNSLNECDVCGRTKECKTGKCWGTRKLGYKCVYPNDTASMDKCFKPKPNPKDCRCAPEDSLSIGKCYYFTDRSINKCASRDCEPRYECIANDVSHAQAMRCVYRKIETIIVPHGVDTCHEEDVDRYSWMPYAPDTTSSRY